MQDDVVLETRALSIGYAPRRGSPRLLASDVTLTLRRGELVCILGPNGAGKSTFLRTVSGLHAPIGGQVLLDGVDVHRLSALDRARAISVVLTDRISAGMLTSYDVVCLGRQPHTDWRGTLTQHDHDMVKGAMVAVGAVDLAARPVAELSDGERQRVMVARALAQAPRLMILDEITAFLDLPRRVEIMRLLQQLAHRVGTAVLVSIHDLDLALGTADQLWLVPGNGRIECGAPEDLVLDGAVERTFTSASVIFDGSRGTFRMRAAAVEAVAITGDGVARHWTARAVERAGYAVAEREAAAYHVEVMPSLERPSWRMSGPSGVRTVSSLRELVSRLREEIAAPGS